MCATSLSRVRLSATPWTAARQAPLSASSSACPISRSPWGSHRGRVTRPWRCFREDAGSCCLQGSDPQRHTFSVPLGLSRVHVAESPGQTLRESGRKLTPPLPWSVGSPTTAPFRGISVYHITVQPAFLGTSPQDLPASSGPQGPWAQSPPGLAITCKLLGVLIGVRALTLMRADVPINVCPLLMEP